MKRSQWVIPGVAVILIIGAAVLIGFLSEPPEVPPSAPTSVESCNLYYLDEAALAEGRAFSLWCPTTGWVELADRPLP